jgi:hypothetical protein
MTENSASSLIPALESRPRFGAVSVLKEQALLSSTTKKTYFLLNCKNLHTRIVHVSPSVAPNVGGKTIPVLSSC